MSTMPLNFQKIIFAKTMAIYARFGTTCKSKVFFTIVENISFKEQYEKEMKLGDTSIKITFMTKCFQVLESAQQPLQVLNTKSLINICCAPHYFCMGLWTQNKW